MKQYLVGITIDKIQSYLFYQLMNKAQESQSNQGTLQSVIQASTFISQNFSAELRKIFSGEANDELVACSGKYIFISRLSKSEITKNLKNLVKKYYVETNGQLMIKYFYSEYPDLDVNTNSSDESYQLIQRANQLLKSSKCLNQMIEENQALLFNCNEAKTEADETSGNETESKDACPYFAKNINALAGESYKNATQADDSFNENHFRIAVIKADLDGMGAIFKSIGSYQVYREISNLLSEFVSIATFHKYIGKQRAELKKNSENNKTNWDEEHLPFEVYPLYIAGDDIFFAVRVEHLLSGINVCKQLLTDLNRRLEQIKNCDTKLSLSLGIDFTFNREPIRYYYTRVNQQLMMAKSEAVYLEKDGNGKPFKKNVGEVATLKIAFNDTVFLDFACCETKEKKAELQKINIHFPSWFGLTQEAYRINDARQIINKSQPSTLLGTRFFYTLLQKLTDEKLKEHPIQYSNAILYHLLPQTWRTGDRELQAAEFTVLSLLIEQLSEPVTKKVAKPLSFEPEYINKLVGYVRGIILLTDPRFNLLLTRSFQENNRQNFPKKGATILTNRSLTYLFKNSLTSKGNVSLRNIFVQKEYYELDKTKSINSENNKKTKESKRINVAVYRTLNIGSAMFHRIKQFEEKKAAVRISQAEAKQAILKMLSFTNNQTENTDEAGASVQKENQAPPNLSFDPAKLEAEMTKGNWNTDYIDSLLIFYQLKQLVIEFKTKIKNK
ncbi:Cas10/Cmr2 second palm domain-containing protein [Enterococcus faecalis]